MTVVPGVYLRSLSQPIALSLVEVNESAHAKLISIHICLEIQESELEKARACMIGSMSHQASMSPLC